MNSNFELVDEYHSYLQKKIIYCLNQTCKRLQVFVIAIFVILIGFHLTKVADEHFD